MYVRCRKIGFQLKAVYRTIDIKVHIQDFFTLTQDTLNYGAILWTEKPEFTHKSVFEKDF